MALNPVRHGAPLLIKEIIFDAHGNITKAEFGSDVHITSRPSRVRLLEVTNRGRTYPAPAQHLGKSVNPDNIIEIANLGIDFYEDFLNKADNFFIK
ncbi:hypothetical protein [Janthinobacterium sp. DSP2-3-3]|uniref:hypothetical protein n=1 Tax=Janthinobacterium sp. DSP2-3-3 TaxID=2804596 RepID=UPI003CF7F261